MGLGELRELVMDREAWRAAVHGVTKSWTQLSVWTELNWILVHRAHLSMGFSRQEHWSGLPFPSPCPSPISRACSIHGHWVGETSNHLILWNPLLLLPSVFPSFRVFSIESVLRIRWPKYWSFNLSISSSNEYSGLISFRIDWFDLLAVQGSGLVAKSCPTLGYPMNCSTPRFLPFAISRSLLKLMPIESVMPSNHLILCHFLLLLPSVFPSFRVFSSELALCMKWPKYWNFSFSISPSKEYSRFRTDSLISLHFKGLSRVFANTTVQKHQFFGAQLSL